MRFARSISRIVILLGVGTALWAQGQNTSQIQGSVQDASGSAVPGADVKATQTDTGAVRTTTTGADGSYVLPNLTIGPYRLEVSKQGFTTSVENGIVLQVATNPTIDVSLKIGSVSERVQVEASAALIETQATGVGNVIENQRIVELPLNGRLATDLIPLVGGTIPQGIAGSSGFPNTINVVVAGGMAFGNAFWLDGALYTEPYQATNMPFPFPDALQEFKVETSSLTAQNGVKSGASITAVTRTGTNQFHGDAFEFIRNGDLNARNFFAPTRDTLKRNQFGGTAGGPVKKDKLFFFAGYQGTFTRQDPANNVAYVPTAAMQKGDFSACPADIPAALKSSFPDNIAPLSSLNPSSLLVAAKLPVSTDPCGKLNFGEITQSNEHQGLGRMDYQMTDKESIFVRYMATTYYRPPSISLTPSDILGSAQPGLNDLAQTLMVGDTYLFSSSTINSFRAAWTRGAIRRTNGTWFDGCSVGVQMYCGYVPGETSVSVTSGFTVGGNSTPSALLENVYQLSDDVTWIHGAHQFGFGVTASRNTQALIGHVYAVGTFSFTSLPAFMLGTINTFNDSAPNIDNLNKYNLGMYAQDTWKITNRLTANIGLRWDPFFPYQVTNGEVYNFSLAKFNSGIKSHVFTNAPAGLTYPGDPGFPNGKGGMNKQWGEFAPRVGLAWDPKGDARMTIRASFGIAYDFNSGEFFANTTNAPPYGDTVSISGGPFNNPFAPNPGANIFPFTVSQSAPFVPYGTFITFSPNLKTTQNNMWNLAIQKQVGSSWLLSATYVGSQAEHLWYTYQVNPASIVPCAGGAAITTCNTTANQNSRRVLTLTGNPSAQYIGFLDAFADGGTASYNGLILAVQKRLSKGVSIDSNYTWSHCIGDLTEGGGTGGAGTGLVDPNNRRRDRSNCQSIGSGGTFSADRRQTFNLSVVAQMPQFSNHVLGAVLTGWQIAGIYRASSAPYYTVTTNTDVALSGASSQRPLQVLPDPLCPNPSPSCWINPAAFATPAPGTLSGLGRDNIPGPDFWQFDVSLSRRFRIREGHTLHFRGDAFNLTNSYRAGIAPPSLSAGTSPITLSYPSSSFGQITSALDPRILQFSLKYIF